MSEATNGSLTGAADDLTGLMKSMIGFAGAATAFSISQVQNVMDGFVNPARTLRRFRSALDSVSDALSSESATNGPLFRGSAATEEALSGRKH